jgi:hypothetical protein
MGLMRMSKVALWSYVYMDFFTWLEHVYFDLDSNQTSAVPFVRKLALSFEGHHGNPGGLCLPGNGVIIIDGIVRATSIAGLLESTRNTTDECAFTLCTISFGVVAIYNHVLCHAESRDYMVPGWIHALQRACILPNMRFHQQHHRPDRPDAYHLHWSMMMGPSRILEKCYLLLGEPENVIKGLFVTCNPLAVSLYQYLRTRTGSRVPSRISGESRRLDGP